MENQERNDPDMLKADAGQRHEDASAAPSEFICAGCGRPLAIALNSTMCFAEALVYCPDCERDYQQRRGQWAPGSSNPPPN